MRTLRLAMLNIVMQPHSPELYRKLFVLAYSLRRFVNLRGKYRGMLGALSDGEQEVRGEFYKFFDLDLDAEWFNITRQEAAEAAELSQINIPENLKPQFDRFEFVFYPSRHRLVFVTDYKDGALSPKTAKKLLEGVFDVPVIEQQFGQIDITIEPRRETLTRILRMPGLRKLVIDLKAPNPDDLASAERQFFREMDRMHAKEMQLEINARSGQQISLDRRHQAMARAAQSNGSVTGIGESTEGRSQTLSTTAHPWIEPVTYDPDRELPTAAVDNAGRQMAARITDDDAEEE